MRLHSNSCGIIFFTGSDCLYVHHLLFDDYKRRKSLAANDHDDELTAKQNQLAALKDRLASLKEAYAAVQLTTPQQNNAASVINPLMFCR